MSLPIVSSAPPAGATSIGSAPVIRVEEVSVRYRVPHERITSFKEYAIRRMRGPRLEYHDLWALREVSLEVAAGEVAGIVGRNGAGKSTLLKVVSRVVRPTRGHVRVTGRVAPLLELGAGFHPELTGRENIFLNGSLLGRSQREIRNRLDEIVAFAELGEVIDAPLRTYSSGMVARLGFAVATAWQPEILILDEVLAVGDEAFQRKCRLRMADFSANGTTILLVSHNAATVREICQRAVWLDHGVIQAIGAAAEVTEAYRRAAAAGTD
ncbi:MAG: ABC transporter ATP-binding protein [Armatimonadetes bacterium]|nr:ABC transporter ATP-binding protein [Armatimonadota bacterium]